ncbi:hypothetical protein HanXRQr2_Chr01g0024101 [Helianthus annuus]|uniref:Uncharacterized protein n=1 Tax=Helianthus annuus TaxID=4232 RepID=A0A251VPV5_HELAN|nr:hypothetical protein HanXRQr2_Chr01g0024101 [Helianthus annuus]
MTHVSHRRCNVSSSRAVLLGSLTGPDIILVSHMEKIRNTYIHHIFISAKAT